MAASARARPSALGAPQLRWEETESGAVQFTFPDAPLSLLDVTVHSFDVAWRNTQTTEVFIGRDLCRPAGEQRIRRPIRPMLHSANAAGLRGGVRYIMIRNGEAILE
jgi:hypothetical protein